MVGSALVPRARRNRDGGAFALSAGSAAGRSAWPYRPLPGRARPCALAVAAALLRLSLGAARDARRRCAGDAFRAAYRPRAGGEADRPRDPAADRRRLLLGRA